MRTREQILGVLQTAGANRFGASAHGFRLDPPMAGSRLAAIEEAIGAPLPEDYRAFLATVGARGAGPGYGLVNLDHPSQWDGPVRDPFRAPETCVLTTVDGGRVEGHSRFTPNREGMVLLADHGCCKLSLLVVHGDDAGAVYTDLECIDQGLRRSHDSFGAWYEAWLDEVAAEVASPLFGEPSLCATPNALSNFLRGYAEKTRDDGDAALSREEVRDALQCIGEAGIASATNRDRFWGEQAVRLCASCAQLLGNFIADGALNPAAVAGGEPPLPDQAGKGGGEPDVVPDCAIPKLSDYVGFLKEVQGGDMMGALTRRGLSMQDYSGIAMAWSQAMMRDPEVMAQYAARMGG